MREFILHLDLVPFLRTSAWWKYFCEAVRIYLLLCQYTRNHIAAIDGTVLHEFLGSFKACGWLECQPGSVEEDFTLMIFICFRFCLYKRSKFQTEGGKKKEKNITFSFKSL